VFNSPDGGVPWNDLRKILPGRQEMASVPNGVETLPKISIARVGRTNVTDRQTDRRQTDGRRHIANVNVSSRSLIKGSKQRCIVTCVPDSSKIGQSAAKLSQFNPFAYTASPCDRRPETLSIHCSHRVPSGHVTSLQSTSSVQPTRLAVI